MKKKIDEKEKVLSAMKARVDSFVDSYDGSDGLKNEMRRRIKRYLAACIEDGSEIDVSPSAIAAKLGTSASDASKTSRYVRRFFDSTGEVPGCMFSAMCEMIRSVVESCNAIVSYVSRHGVYNGKDVGDVREGRTAKARKASPRRRRKSAK